MLRVTKIWKPYARARGLYIWRRKGIGDQYKWRFSVEASPESPYEFYAGHVLSILLRFHRIELEDLTFKRKPEKIDKYGDTL